MKKATCRGRVKVIEIADSPPDRDHDQYDTAPLTLPGPATK